MLLCVIFAASLLLFIVVYVYVFQLFFLLIYVVHVIDFDALCKVN